MNRRKRSDVIMVTGAFSLFAFIAAWTILGFGNAL